MAEDQEYQQVVSLVDSIASASTEESTSIDVGEVFLHRLPIKEIGYAEADKMFEKGALSRPAPQEAPIQPSVQQPKPQVQVQVPKHEVRKETEGAAAGLRRLMGGAGKEYAESVTREEKEKEEQLVMPKLSVQDQLSDLEKIKEGIDENVFDKEQLGIIVEEVSGMSKIAAREDTNRMSADQRELVLMRNQRIKEIKGRLNIK